ncbi:MAG: AraC family transcriptional regulator, partial [Bosea sp. (in: a-proteobacteria)]
SQGSDAPLSFAWPEESREEDCEVLTLLLPRETSGLVPDAAEPLQLDPTGGAAALLADFVAQLAKQLVEIPEERAGQLAVAAHAMVKACASTTAAIATPTQPALKSGSTRLVEKARLVVHRNMASPEFGPGQLARLLAVSRSKLYRLLEAQGGAAHFINQERLAEAFCILAATDEAVSVHAIATQVGFKDHSTFSRAFRRAFGCSPTVARERAQGGDPLLPQRAAPENPAMGNSRSGNPQRGVAVAFATQTAPAPRGAGRPASFENGMNGADLGFSADPASGECC